jgi:hypothetical protein
VLAIVTGLFLVVGVQAPGVERELRETRRALVAATQAFAAEDHEQAAARLELARSAVDSASGRASAWNWAAASVVPLAGRTPAAIRKVVAVASAAVDVAEGAAAGTDELAGAASGGDVFSFEASQVDLDRVTALGELVDRLPTDHLADAYERLSAHGAGWLPKPVREGREDVLDLADTLLTGLERAEAATSVLPGFLGRDGERRYFLGMQTPAELRGTGGLISYFSVVTIHDGTFTLGDPDVQDDGTDDGATKISRLSGTEPVATSPEFAERYGHAAADRNLSNVNVDPDLPTTAPVILDIYHSRVGEQLDGLFLVDPVGLGQLLDGAGPVTVPPDVRDPGGILPESVPADEIAELLQVGIYEVYGEDYNAERREFLSAFSDAAFQAVLDASHDGADLLERLTRMTRGRHVQIHSVHGDEQAAFTSLGVTGDLAPRTSPSDLLAVTANNATGGKMDVHLSHRIRAELDLELGRSDDLRARREGSIRVTVGNPLPDEGMDLYIIGNCLVDDAQSRCFQGPPGLNRTWFSVWAPAGSDFHGMRDPTGDLPLYGGSIRGQEVVDRYLETPARSENWFETDLGGDVELVADGGELVYRLTWWRQAKAVPDELELAITAPEGWDVGDFAVTGGGPDGAVEVRAQDRVLRITGPVTEDLEIELRLRRGTLARMLERLQEPAFRLSF